MSSPQPFSQSPTRSRPSVSQDSMLVLLPNEMITQIVELIASQRDSRHTLDRLSQTCVRMYQIVRPYFYRAENFLQFYNAVSIVNMTMMERCEYFGAAPVNITWNRPALRRCRPVDLLLLNVDEGNDRRDTADRAALRNRERDNTFYALGWLLERDANGEASMANESSHGVDLPCDHMSSRMLRQFQVGTSKRGSEVLFNMIRMLSRNGYSNPTRRDSVSGWFCIDQAAWFKGTMRDYYTTSPLDLALKSHVMPSLLNLMLEEYEARGLRLRDWHSQCPPSLVQSARRETTIDSSISWVEISYIDTLVGTLHADLHNETTKWSESYSGEAADIFRAKLDIMIKHEMIDNAERALLGSIGAALYRIAARGRAAGDLGDEHFKMSWEMLCDAVRPFVQDHDLVQDPLPALDDNGPGRIHRFAINSDWNPWKQWLLRRDARLRHRKMLASGTIRRVPTRVWEHAWQYDLLFILPYANYTQVPAWHTVGLDEWLPRCRTLKGFSF
ncbi:uncharacterized protein FTOL_09638 [Fusarium torulosum]|uniref:F-box domain-containing protein n=1 Tax=Fusarium torulosum TaxID=33205 RepID=A0AAE8SLA0_9HYPO|nr:uncharacterized protein FTOL_09638 [Fusarium torulosum]